MSQTSNDFARAERVSRFVVLGSGIWTMAIWLSRIGLIEPDAGTLAYVRLYVVLAFGAALLYFGARRSTLGALQTTVMLGYGLLMVIVWVPSLIDTLGSDNSLAFRVVHTLLALGSLTSGALVANTARRQALYPPITTSTQTAANSAAR